MEAIRNRVILIYDTTSENNDKYWLTKELKKEAKYEIIEIYASTKLSQLWSSKKVTRKLRAYKQILFQLRSAKKILSKEPEKKSIVVCWSIMTGMLSLFVIPRKIPVFSLNWLTPDKRLLNSILKKRLLSRKTFYAFADSEGTRKEIIDFYSPKYQNNIGVFPDTFNYLGAFKELREADVEARRKKSICFTGGRNNRDWDCFLQTAKLCPEYSFLGIGINEEYSKTQIPSNVQLFNKVNEDYYYSAMKDAYLIYLPLNDKRAAGAINIFRAAMNQQLCIITDAPSTGIYFPKENKNQLLPIHDAEYNASIIKKMFSLSNGEYIGIVRETRKYLLASFSPSIIAGGLSKQISEVINK